MPEYVRVNFPEARDVFVDGMQMSTTNIKFRIGTGTYTFDLGDPDDYTPSQIQQSISGTTQDFPQEIYFAKK